MKNYFSLLFLTLMLVSYNTTAQDSIKKDKIKIIVGSFKYEWNAIALYSLFKSKGYKEVNVLPKTNGFHRVSIKAFYSKKEADLFIVENNLSEKDYWYIFPKKNVPLVSVKEIDSISVRKINSLNVVENNKRSGSAISSSTLLPSLIDTYSPNELEDVAGVNVPPTDVASATSSPTEISNEIDNAAVTEVTTTDTPTATILEDFLPIESTKITSDTSSNSNATAKHFFDVSLGFASTDFTYVDSAGNSDVEFIPGNKNFLSLNYSFQIRKNFFIRTGIDLLSFGTTSQDIANGNTYEWDTSYIGIGTGIDWKIFSVKKISLKAQSRIGFANITSGTQKINLTTFDITDDSEFNGNHLYYSFGLALNFKLSKNIIIGINASNLVYTNVGLTVFPKPDVESLKQVAENFGFSVIFPINK
ncbi:SPOR domain-containing protein [Flavobacteriaceae bacterium]|nr:SPOR domain-containing protein [Flavobacteriaceae bacterium]